MWLFRSKEERKRRRMLRMEKAVARHRAVVNYWSTRSSAEEHHNVLPRSICEEIAKLHGRIAEMEVELEYLRK